MSAGALSDSVQDGEEEVHAQTEESGSRGGRREVRATAGWSVEPGLAAGKEDEERRGRRSQALHA